MATRGISRPGPTAIPRRVAPVRSSARDGLGRVLPIVVLFYAVLVPTEIRIELAGQFLYPTRLVEFCLLPWIFWQFAKRQFKPVIWDVLFVIGCLWMLVAFVAIYGAQIGLLSGGALVVDTLLPYIIGRLAIRNSTDIRRFLVLIAPGLLLAGLSLLVEVMVARPLIRPWAASVFGALPQYEGGIAVGARGFVTEQRLGLLRATGPFAHPILAGICVSGFLALFLYSGLRRWPFFVGVGASLLGVFSLSSAAFLGIALSLGLLITDQIQRMLAFISWRIILPAAGGLLFILHMLTENGLIAYVGRFTLNPASAGYRRLIMHFGSESVMNNPIFGIGFRDYERPVWMVKASVDNQWLLLAIRFGILPALMQIAVIVAAILLLSVNSSHLNETERRLRVGMAVALAVFALLGFTVSFYGGVEAWFYMFLAMGISLSYSDKQMRLLVQRKMALKRPAVQDSERQNGHRPKTWQAAKQHSPKGS